MYYIICMRILLFCTRLKYSKTDKEVGVWMRKYREQEDELEEWINKCRDQVTL